MVALEFDNSPEVAADYELCRNPSLYLINTRTFLRDLSLSTGRKVYLKDVPDDIWKDIAQQYDAIWLMGIYKPSEMSRLSALNYQHQYRGALNDLKEEDVVASPFSICSYTPNPDIAKDWDEWDEVYHKLHDIYGLKVILDFVPNHVALDHPWVIEKPGFFITHPSRDPSNNPDHFYRVPAQNGEVRYIAHGKDPNYPPWLDTVQLNYEYPELQEAMIQEVLSLVSHCDGLRCDMAMLLNDDTFYRTWGWMINDPWPGEFWAKVIPAAKDRAFRLGKNFLFLGEAYWNDDRLVGEGFDGLYEKEKLYNYMKDLAEGKPHAWKIRDRLRQISRSRYNHVVFTENHDEKRAIEVLGYQPSKAFFTTLAFADRVILMIHQGQPEGMQLKVPMQVNRTPNENKDVELQEFYAALLYYRQADIFKYGMYDMLEPESVGGNDYTHSNIIPQQFKYNDEVIVINTNLSSERSKAHIWVPSNARELSIYSVENWTALPDDSIAKPSEKGLYIELGPWETQVVRYKRAS